MGAGLCAVGMRLACGLGVWWCRVGHACMGCAGIRLVLRCAGLHVVCSAQLGSGRATCPAGGRSCRLLHMSCSLPAGTWLRIAGAVHQWLAARCSRYISVVTAWPPECGILGLPCYLWGGRSALLTRLWHKKSGQDFMPRAVVTNNSLLGFVLGFCEGWLCSRTSCSCTGLCQHD